MLFNSGFGGALGTISGLLRKSDVAILDNRSHLSLRDGAILSRCRTEKFEHNDPASLDVALSRQKGRRQLVVVEGIYSMDGDFGALREVLDVADAHGASVSLTKRIRCSRAVRMVGELLSTSALKTGSRWCTARFQKRSERWAVSSPVRRRRFSISVFTRIRTYTRARCHRS